MSKLLSVLVAAVFAAASFSAVAADAAHAAAPAKAAAPAAAAPAAPAAPAAEPKKANSQQTKMKLCNKEAKEKGLKKAERKAFMKSCLKA